MKRRTKNIFIYVLIISSITVNLVMGIQMISFTNNINTLDNEIMFMQYNMADVNEKLDKEIKRQNSIIDSIDVNLGSLNKEKLTVEMSLSITLKEYKEGAKVSLLINNEPLFINEEDSLFTATTEISIFDNVSGKIVLEYDNVNKMETLDILERDKLMEQYLLNNKISFKGENSYSKLGKYNLKGYLEIRNIYNSENKAKKVTVITQINNDKVYEEVKEEDIVNDKIDIEKNIKLEKGDKCTSYVLIEDSYGLRYKYIIDKFRIDEKGEVQKDTEKLGCVEIRDDGYQLVWEQ